eukprot:3534200-Amphidinium_carterae.1
MDDFRNDTIKLPRARHRRSTLGTTSTRESNLLSYLYNQPQDYPVQARQLDQTHYLVSVHTTTRLVQEFIDDHKELQNRRADWHTRRGFD